MTQRSVYAWHILPDDRCLRYPNDHGIRQPVATGETITVSGELKLCERGLHWSHDILDAARYGHGATICRVRVSGDILYGEDGDKGCSSERTVLWMIAGTQVLQSYRLACIEMAIQQQKNFNGPPLDPRLDQLWQFLKGGYGPRHGLFEMVQTRGRAAAQDIEKRIHDRLSPVTAIPDVVRVTSYSVQNLYHVSMGEYAEQATAQCLLEGLNEVTSRSAFTCARHIGVRKWVHSSHDPMSLSVDYPMSVPLWRRLNRTLEDIVMDHKPRDAPREE